MYKLIPVEKMDATKILDRAYKAGTELSLVLWNLENNVYNSEEVQNICNEIEEMVEEYKNRVIDYIIVKECQCMQSKE